MMSFSIFSILILGFMLLISHVVDNKKAKKSAKANCSALLALGLYMIVLAVNVFCFDSFAKQEIVKPGEEVVSFSQELTPFDISSNGKYYLTKDGDEIRFSYFDKSDGITMSEVDVGSVDDIYYGTEGSSKAYFTIYEATNVVHRKWLFLKGSDYKEVSYRYVFHIPTKNNIYYIN